MLSDRKSWLSVATLVAVLALFAFTPLDLIVQDWFWYPSEGRWFFARHEPGWHFMLYEFPKVIFGVLLVGITVPLFLPEKWQRPWFLSKRKTIFVLACLLLIPATVGLAKQTTDVYCPKQVTRYNGSHPYYHIFAKRPPREGRRCGRCFPAAHASGGFALLAFAFVTDNRRRQVWAVIIAMLLGWTIGLYQMARGEHFLGHTVVTMVWAWCMANFLKPLAQG